MSFSHISHIISNNITTFASDMNKELYNRRRHHLGFLFQYERKCQSLTQEELALKLGVSQDFISKFEVSKRRIDLLELIDYCDALNLSLTEFAWKIEDFFYGLSLHSLPKSIRLENKIRVEVSWSENRFSASLREIVQESLELTADTFVNLQDRVADNLVSLIDGMDGNKVPRWLKNKEYEFEYKFLDATSLLKAYSTYIPLAVISRATKINQNLLSQYANGLKKAGPNQMKRMTEAIHKIGKGIVAVVP